MQRSGSQTILLVLSIIVLIGAVIGFFLSLFFMFGAGVMGAASSSDLAELTNETGMSGSELAALTGGLGIASIVESIVSLLMGIFGIRAANDANKVMPVWIFALISLVLGVIVLIINVVAGGGPEYIVRSIGSLVVAALVFWIANNIKTKPGQLRR